MIEVHVYGRLRRHAPDARASGESMIHLEPRAKETVGTVLGRIGIAPDEVCHIFLNGSILSSKNTMAPWLRYQEISGGGLDTPVTDSDRLGLFASDMALLVV
jgi:hypothetical protein